MTATAPSRERVRNYRYSMLLLTLGAIVTVSAVRIITDSDQMTSPFTLSQAIIAACPILLAGLGGLWSERAGIVNIGLEGQMLLGTWGAAYFAYHHGAFAGLVDAALMGVLGGLLHAIATVSFGIDHIISGVAINIIGLGAIGFLAKLSFTDLEGGGPRNLSGYDTLPNYTIPGISSAARDLAGQHWFVISDIAGAVAAVTTNVSLLTILVVVLVIATAWILWHSTFGLRLRSCGESPQAAETLGVNVYLYKYSAVLISGGLAGLGGAYLTMVSSSSFSVGQTNGRGYIGLAAMIFGNWRPSGVVTGALMFGYTDGLASLNNSGRLVHSLLLLIVIFLVVYAVLKLRSGQRSTAITVTAIAVACLVWYLTSDSVPTEFTGMTPYIVTLFVLSVASQRLRMPAASGKPYRKGSAG